MILQHNRAKIDIRFIGVPYKNYWAAAMVFKKGRKPMAINRVTNTKRTDKAFITGETPNRIIEYTYRGNVVEPGPDTKKVITKLF